MRKGFIAALILVSLNAQANTWVALETEAGHLVIELLHEAAPETSAQILKLVENQVYDGNHFYRVDPQFLIQTAVAEDRLIPLRPDQLAEIRALPLEVSPQWKHLKHRVTLARDPGNPESARSSFSILAVDAPHLDGQYTVFGRLVGGGAVFNELLRVKVDYSRRPLKRLGILRAFRVDSLSDPRLRLNPPKDWAQTYSSSQGALRFWPQPWVVLCAGLALGTGFFLRRVRWGSVAPARVGGALLLSASAYGCFLEWESLHWPFRLAAGAFLVCSYFLWGRFEERRS